MTKEYKEKCYSSYCSTHMGYLYRSSIRRCKFLWKAYGKILIKFLPKDKGSYILDIGCGDGALVYNLQKMGYKNTIGIDTSKEQIEAAKELGVKNVLLADCFEYLPQHKGEFTVIIACNLIEHFRKDEVMKFLELVYSALKQGEIVILVTDNMFAPFGPGVFFSDFTHETGFAPYSISQVLRVSGYKKVRVYGIGPLGYDLRSFLRVILWEISKPFVKLYLLIQCGTGRGIWKNKHIIEPMILAYGEKDKC